MRRHALWLGLMVLALSAPSALAQCDDYTSVEYQVTDWWDGVSTVQILNITDYTVCDYGGGGGGGYYDPSGGGGSAPTVSLSASVVTHAVLDLSQLCERDRPWPGFCQPRPSR
jgi:hypothetical protein